MTSNLISIRINFRSMCWL